MVGAMTITCRNDTWILTNTHNFLRLPKFVPLGFRSVSNKLIFHPPTTELNLMPLRYIYCIECTPRVIDKFLR